MSDEKGEASRGAGESAKSALRKTILGRAAGDGSATSTFQAGKAAEIIRRLPIHRRARQLFISPAPLLRQIRINALVDGKEVVMPSAGLKEGFYLFKPYTIPFRDLPFAVSLQGAAKHGRRISLQALASLRLDALVTEVLAFDGRGARLGDGSGFFDLAYAILAEAGALAPQSRVLFVAGPEQRTPEPLPVEEWDVPGDLVVTDRQTLEIAARPAYMGRIFWDQLQEKRIRRIKPLWQLAEAREKKDSLPESPR